MADDDQSKGRRQRHVWRRVMIALAVCVGLLIIFHRPILLGIVRHFAIRYATKENLKMDFRLEGNPFSYLTIRNLHAVPTGPSAIESVDVDSLYVDYSLFGLARHGVSHLLQNVELRGAQVVVNPARAPPKPRPKQKPTLPDAFPERIRLADATIIVRESPNDFVIEHVDLDLNPSGSGELRIGRLQLPSGDSWSSISGQTSYSNKNFILRALALSDQDQIRLLNIDASRIDSKALVLTLDGVVGGGQLSVSAALNEGGSFLNAKVDLAAEKIPADSLNKFLSLPENYLTGEIERLALVGTGVIDSPRTWSGTMSLRAADAHLPAVNFDKATVEVSAGHGKATLQSADLVQNENEFHLNGTIDLPATFQDFGRTPASLQIAGKAPDLEKLTAGLPLGLTGSVQFNGKIDIVDANAQATFGVTGEAVGFSDGIIDNLNATLRASKKVARGDTKRPWFGDLRTAMEFTLTGIRYRDYIVDSVNGSMNGSDDILGLDGVTLRRNQNELSIRGRYQLPENIGNAPSQPVQLDIAFNANEIGDFWVANSPNKISGPLQMTGRIERKQGIVNGQMSLSGSNLKMRDLVVQRLSAQSLIANNVVHLNECSATLNNTDYVNATGTFNLQPPQHYSGKASASVLNLAVLEPLLRVSGNQSPLAGSFKLDWEGSGNAQAFKNTGNLKLVLEKARYGNLQGLQANIDASYSPEGLDVPIIFFATTTMDFNAIARTKGDVLEIDKIQLNQVVAPQPQRARRSGATGEAVPPQQRTNYAYGYVSLPFVWRNLGTKSAVIPSSGNVSAIVQSENLDLKRLAQALGIKAITSGIVNARLDASGTIADLNAHLDLQARDLRSEYWPKMEPATFELTAQTAQDRLTFSGKLQQARLQPVEVNGSMPFDIPKIARARKVADDTPITAKAHVPRSSVNFVRQFVPELQQLDGELGLDVGVSGTLGHPVLSGAGDMTVNVARFTNATLPALRSFSARLTFRDNALTLDRFGGDLAGGPFTMSGRVTFAKLTEPILDLQVRAQSVLVARNDTLTARADADVKITGPLAAATVSGNVALTDSRFLKNIDLIPIGLPGRPAPQAPAERPDFFSLPSPPFRDWKFDVAIKTKNPVLIRGNLATGDATTDLKLTGTGVKPGLRGVVQMEGVEATLPFSRLDVSRGSLTFDPSDSTNPTIDLHGTSVIRDYTVRVYVYGTLLSPQAIFTSEPPLPQEEIISLIATGTTRKELSTGNVLAGRAAMLLFQQLYRKIVKKGEPTDSNTVFNRLDLDLGTVDPRTGQQQATVRFKVTDQIVLTGDVGVHGDFRGKVKYLIRFR
ncbi:MAG TPA: translocation/assembly module TamB domain-containing protein [Candidatus Udaeobacter sp.]|nr:translocation/assembly module TamB domain-containing protein [Candidatus Udaeobacter sp.]